MKSKQKSSRPKAILCAAPAPTSGRQARRLASYIAIVHSC